MRDKLRQYTSHPLFWTIIVSGMALLMLLLTYRGGGMLSVNSLLAGVALGIWIATVILMWLDWISRR